MELIGRLALEALEFRHVQRRILRGDERVGGDVDAFQRGHRLVEIVAPTIRLGEHDLRVALIRLECDGLREPHLRIVEPVGKEGNPTEAEHRRIVVGMVGGDPGVFFARLGKLPAFKEPRGGIAGRRLLLRRLCRESARREHLEQGEANFGCFHFQVRAGKCDERNISAKPPDPPLTTVDGMGVQKGRAAARIVFGGGPPRHKMVEPQLIMRSSTGPAPKSEVAHASATLQPGSGQPR